LLLAVATLNACGTPLPEVPEAPAMLTRSVEYGFGDAIAAADAAAIARVVDLLRPRHGTPEVTRYTASARSDLAGLRTYYDARTAAAGWHPIAEIGGAVAPGENAIGYRASDTAFVVVWLTPRPGWTTTPVNVIRFKR
jgi:hypothetical protein